MYASASTMPQCNATILHPGRFWRIVAWLSSAPIIKHLARSANNNPFAQPAIWAKTVSLKLSALSRADRFLEQNLVAFRIALITLSLRFLSEAFGVLCMHNYPANSCCIARSRWVRMKNAAGRPNRFTRGRERAFQSAQKMGQILVTA